MEKTLKLEKLELLESRIANTLEIVSELNSRCQNLARKNEVLELKVSELTNTNVEMSEQLNDIQTHQGMDEKAVLNKIDRMLEKFGELQI